MYRENRTSRTFSESKKWEEGIFFFHVELKSFEVILEESESERMYGSRIVGWGTNSMNNMILGGEGASG